MRLKLVVAAAFAAAITFCIVGAASAGGTKSSGTTFHLVEKDLAFNFIDNKPIEGRNEPPTLGDMFVFTSTLWTRGMKRAGQLYASCVVTSGGRHSVSVCTGSFTLKGGELELQTAIRDQPGAKPDHIAIVGGTGAYEGARGVLTSVSRGQNTPYSDDTVHLLPQRT